MTDIRNHLFETLEALKDNEKPMEVERALAIGEIAKVLVESAKVEVAFLRATEAVVDARFFDSPADEPIPRRLSK